MVIIVSGNVGLGKTTVCLKVIEIAQKQGYGCGGIISYKTQKDEIIIKDVQTGKTKILASTLSIYHGPRTAKYFFNLDGIDFGNKAIDRSISSDITVIDEFGYLELQGQGFTRSIKQVANGAFKTSMIVIRTELLSSYLLHLGARTAVFDTNLDNRNKLPDEIFHLLQQDLRTGSCSGS